MGNAGASGTLGVLFLPRRAEISGSVEPKKRATECPKSPHAGRLYRFEQGLPLRNLGVEMIEQLLGFLKATRTDGQLLDLRLRLQQLGARRNEVLHGSEKGVAVAMLSYSWIRLDFWLTKGIRESVFMPGYG